jgi:integrase
MARIRARKDNGKLFFDFRIGSKRFREQTELDETPTNRKKMEKVLDRIESEIQAGTFDYQRYFPGSKRAAIFAASETISVSVKPVAVEISNLGTTLAKTNQGPAFKEFADTWYSENEISWRRSHQRTIKDIIDNRLIPEFGEKWVGQITKADILAFRSTLAKVPGRKATTLTAKSINAIMAPLRQILNEAADRFEFNTPYRNIKALKVQRSDVEPFTLDEVQSILNTARTDYQHYYTVRFFTGLRTGEIDGLKWKYVDFKARQVLIRETIVAGEEEYTKTDASQREIQMSGLVFDALTAQAKITKGKSAFVFANRDGQPLDHNNVTKRVWYPLLRHLGLKERRPYQTRHTAATLWLASGENPLWIARQLGHSSTEMLFKVYGRFVPNLTRQDGSAFERLLLQSGAVKVVGADAPAANDFASSKKKNDHD